MFLRRHWIVPLKLILTSLCLAAIPIIFYVLLVNLTTYFEDPNVIALTTILASAYYLFVILFTFTNFVDYYLDAWIVTNMRIINIEQRGLFSRVISEKDLETMQDITANVTGFLPTLLQYGDIHIQTAGRKENFIFKEVPFANEVAQRISNFVAEYQKVNREIEPNDIS